MVLKKIINNIHVKLLMSGLVIFFLFALLILYINLGSVEVPFLAPAAFFREGIFIMFQMIASLYFVHYTIGWNNKRHQNHLNSSRRFLEEISFIVVIGFAITQLFHFLFVYITVKPEPDVETLSRRLRQLQMVSITFLLIIYAVMTTYRIFRSLQRKNLEVVKWEKEFAQAQFEVLKNQLNPHFLFNSLSALTTLVHKNAFVAEEFIGQLSKTYRYLLEQKDKHLVALKQEIDFLKNYLFLARQRYGTKLSVEINDEACASTLYILPHSLLIVMEFIIAGNGMSEKSPLSIRITVENERVMVRHVFQPKKMMIAHMESQMNNLKERYRELLQELNIEQDTERNERLIKLPLIHAPQKG